MLRSTALARGSRRDLGWTFGARAAAAAALLAALAVTTPASANTLIGKQFTVGYYYPNTSSLYGSAAPNPAGPFTVGAGAEASIDVENLLRIGIDVGASTVDISFQLIGDADALAWANAAFNGLILTLQSGTLGFDGIIVTPQAAMPGFDSSRAGISATQITFNWQGLPYSAGIGSGVPAVHADLTAVPVPAALPLMLAALGGFALVGRRRVLA